MAQARLTLVEEIEKRARPLETQMDLKALLDSVKHADVVMLGEASHGTHEFYQWRKWISQELIHHHGFRFIAVEGDWPPCQQVNQFVRFGIGGTAQRVLEGFQRWPTWMWSNYEILELVQWLRHWNQAESNSKPVGFYGLDVYSLFESIDEVVRLLGSLEPSLLPVLKERYACFEPYRRDEKKYVRSLLQFSAGCEEEVLRNLKDLLALRLRDDKSINQDVLFDATQNARIVANAERYYRSMIHVDDESWNIRDQHMMESLDLLKQRYGKGIVWEHNTHIGDYRATDMLAHGHVNIGGLARQRWGHDRVALVGFGTYQGSVTASHAWAGPVQTIPVPQGMPGSYEDAFHTCSLSLHLPDYYLLFDEKARQTALSETRGHRAIGVVYDHRQERRGNYVPTSLAERYDAFLFFDQTRALTPLATPIVERDIPETFPSGV